jgi:allophanate hydrolase
VAETVLSIVAAHRAGRSTPAETLARTYARIRAHNDPAVFITLRDEADALAEARALAAKGDTHLSLYGVPVAVKDNIDVAGLPTTAACPAFSYNPAHDATAVARLRAAGAIVIGKTNLDQFATGLVGVRSPYGVPRNTFDAKLVPGGSSSGSAVAVAAGLVPLALGTDTAGSGRVPAGFNNIVGLKPSLGLISTHAARSIAFPFLRSRSTMPGRAWPPSPVPMPPTAIRATGRSAGPVQCRRISSSACRCPASGCSSAIKTTKPDTTRR